MARVDPEEGNLAFTKWLRHPGQIGRGDLLLAVRHTLQALAADLPGRSVEVRVPPAGAVQILGGTTHRRGTPPAVVEMSPHTWLSLCAGEISWEKAEENGLVDASGEGANLAQYFPRL